MEISMISRRFGIQSPVVLLALSSTFAVLLVSAQRQGQIIADLGKLIVENCPPMLCTGLDCAIVTERNGCQLCACPIGSPARGCDPMPFVLWHDLIVNGCPNVTVSTRDPAQKVHRWFRRVNRFSNTDQCEPYIFPYCPELDFNLWRSPRTKQECELYCYSVDEQAPYRTPSDYDALRPDRNVIDCWDHFESSDLNIR